MCLWLQLLLYKATQIANGGSVNEKKNRFIFLKNNVISKMLWQFK